MPAAKDAPKPRLTNKAAAAGKPTLLEIARSKHPDRRRQTWIDRIDPAVRVQLEELRTAYLAGELDPGWSIRALIDEVLAPAGIQLPVNADTFRNWLRYSR